MKYFRIVANGIRLYLPATHETKGVMIDIYLEQSPMLFAINQFLSSLGGGAHSFPGVV